jgi:hypothetical protein
MGTSGRVDEASEPIWLNRSVIETAGLVAALLLIGGFIGYWLWPPSAEYLYKNADKLMASTSRHDWRTALDEYIIPLDERFPDHPHREQTRAWRDQIMLEEVEGRASNLSSPAKTAFNEPRDNLERSFVLTDAVAADASKRGDDLTAISEWQKFAQQMKPDDPEQRKWHLVGLKRAKSLENEIALRRQYVEKQLQLAMEAFRAGRTNQGETINSKLREQYAKYTDLADLFPPSPAPAEATPKTPPPGAVDSPGAANPPPTDGPEPKAAPKPAEPRPTADPAAESPPEVTPSEPPPREEPKNPSP